MLIYKVLHDLWLLNACAHLHKDAYHLKRKRRCKGLGWFKALESLVVEKLSKEELTYTSWPIRD